MTQNPRKIGTFVHRFTNRSAAVTAFPDAGKRESMADGCENRDGHDSSMPILHTNGSVSLIQAARRTPVAASTSRTMSPASGRSSQSGLTCTHLTSRPAPTRRIVGCGNSQLLVPVTSPIHPTGGGAGRSSGSKVMPIWRPRPLSWSLATQKGS